LNQTSINLTHKNDHHPSSNQVCQSAPKLATNFPWKSSSVVSRFHGEKKHPNFHKCPALYWLIWFIYLTTIHPTSYNHWNGYQRHFSQKPKHAPSISGPIGSSIFKDTTNLSQRFAEAWLTFSKITEPSTRNPKRWRRGWDSHVIYIYIYKKEYSINNNNMANIIELICTTIHILIISYNLILH
jgi:hypothetical protein